jgi:sarcosine oxidase
MTPRFDLIVVGLGAMGSATCYHLARRGAKVLGLEQFDIPNSQGSSQGHSRMIRKIYHEHDDYIPILEKSYELWAELEKASGLKLLHQVGGLYLGAPDCDSIAGTIRAAEKHKLAHEVLDRGQIASRFPQFHVDERTIGIWEPTTGFMSPEAAVGASCHCALLAGAELRGNEAVLRWEEAKNGEVTVVTSRRTYRAKGIAFCGGPWTNRLVAGLGVELRVTRQVAGWVWPKKPEQFTVGKFPCWSYRQPNDRRFYGMPLTAGAPGHKVARHERKEAVDPLALIREILPDDEATFRPGLSSLLPDADGPTVSIRVCMYTNTPDFHCIIDRDPRYQRAWIACGFSGHGFKFSCVVGSILADLALTGRSDLPIGFLGFGRFSRPRAVSH